MNTVAHQEQTAVEEAVKQLTQLLADTYVLLVKTQNFHWNLVDSRFYSLHKLFEEQYEDLQEAVDTIAERIRVFNVRALGSMKEFMKASHIHESQEQLGGNVMIEELLRDHQFMSRQLVTFSEKLEKQGDPGTVDLFVQRIRVHDKAAWMLRSQLTNKH